MRRSSTHRARKLRYSAVTVLITPRRYVIYCKIKNKYTKQNNSINKNLILNEFEFFLKLYNRAD